VSNPRASLFAASSFSLPVRLIFGMAKDISFPVFLILRQDDDRPLTLHNKPGQPNVFPIFETLQAAADFVVAMKLEDAAKMVTIPDAESLTTWGVEITQADEIWWNPTKGPKGLRRLRRTFVDVFLPAIREQAEREKKGPRPQDRGAGGHRPGEKAGRVCNPAECRPVTTSP
jgi:hypothetical protein